MGSIFSYAMTSSIILCFGYLAYKLILAGERQHTCNRLILYVIYAMSLLLPLLSDEWRGLMPEPSSSAADVVISELPTDFTDNTEEAYITAAFAATDMDESERDSLSLPTIATIIYIIGVILSLIYSIFGLYQLCRIISDGERIKTGEYILIISNRDDIAPFSWLHFYVMNRNDYETAGDLIALHEMRHLKLRHWIDLVVVQVVSILQWFNPAAWLMGDEFKIVHEYQADDAVLSSGVDMRQYQTLLIKKAVGTRFQVLANSLNHSKLKKRIAMMYKTNPSKGRRLTALLVIPAMAVGCLATEFPAVASIIGSTSDISIMAENDDKVNNFIPDSESNTGLIIAAEENITATAPSTPEINGGTESETAVTAKSESISPEDDDKVYTSADVLAEFPGSMPGLMKWIGENMHYPENAYKNGIQGRVIVKLVIGKDGSVKDTKIIKGVDKELDKESLRLVKSMPKWKPAEIDGKPVASYFTMPISFKIKDNSTSTNEAVKEAKPTTDLIYNTLKNGEKVYIAVESPAEFPDGMPALMKWLSTNLKYPEEAAKNDVQGRVVVKFIVDKDGSVRDATVVKGVDKELDKEAIRLVMSMPKWVPAKVNEQVVASYFNLPVTFKITAPENESTTTKQ